MDVLELISLLLHLSIGSFGIVFNALLLYLIVKKSPKSIRVYAIMLSNFAITDLLACLTGIFAAQRIIPCGTVLTFTSIGLCSLFNHETCFVAHCVNLAPYSHTLWSTLISFFYRYYALFYTFTPRRIHVIVILLIFLIPSILQSWACSWYALAEDSDPEDLKMILKQNLPDYNFEGETLYGITDIMDLRILLPLIHMTCPITPVYIVIIIMRRRILSRLSNEMVSVHSRRLHQQLLGALTAQAALPFFYFLAILVYSPGQFKFFNHPILEYLPFILFAFIPTLSPVINFYFIRPYRMAILKVVRRVEPISSGIWKTNSHE